MLISLRFSENQNKIPGFDGGCLLLADLVAVLLNPILGVVSAVLGVYDQTVFSAVRSDCQIRPN